MPQSKLLFPLYYISLLVVILDFLRSRLEPHLAGWLTLAYASVPLIYYHATIAYANLPLTFYLAGGVILAINKLSLRSDRPVAPGDREQGASELGEWVLSGCFFALAAWTRPEGLVISIMCWTFLAGVLFVRQRKIVKLSQLLSKLAAFSVPLLIVSGFWLASSGDVYRKPGWSQEVIRSGVAQALSGTLQFEQMSIVMRRFLSGFFDLQTWGVLGISIIVLLLFVPIITRRGRPDWIIAGPALIAIVLILGMYLILAQDLNHGADWWVNTGLSRMLLPGMTLLWLGLVAQVQIPATAAQT